MIAYKAVKNKVAHYIQENEVVPVHADGYMVIKEVNNVDTIKVLPTEEIPEGFLTKEVNK